MTADQIQACSVETIEPLSRPIELAEFDPAWPARFVQNDADAKGEVVEAIAARAGIGGPHP